MTPYEHAEDICRWYTERHRGAFGLDWAGLAKGLRRHARMLSGLDAPVAVMLIERANAIESRRTRAA